MIGGNQRDVCLVQRARQPASRRWEPLRRQLRRLCLRACHTNHDFPTSARESMSALSILTISSMSHSESKENGVACLKVYWTAARTKVYQFSLFRIASQYFSCRTASRMRARSMYRVSRLRERRLPAAAPDEEQRSLAIAKLKKFFGIALIMILPSGWSLKSIFWRGSFPACSGVDDGASAPGAPDHTKRNFKGSTYHRFTSTYQAKHITWRHLETLAGVACLAQSVIHCVG